MKRDSRSSAKTGINATCGCTVLVLTPHPKKTQTDPPNIMLFDYQNSRAGHCAKDYLQDYQSYLQVDGYAGYEKTDAMLAGCFAHARR